ncbi:helix-turn-helix domain-containing protein [Kutzneria sp. NPDC051319]|uniref:helix-turn-helix domain-containing protein n=1 Tax=Kutzneria sp. NPDC051319 TaxID=3155047 RepID=UPI0034189AEB
MIGHSAFQPVRLPDAVWSSQDTVAVLRDRRIGQLFVLARRHAGASQARIAAATGLNQSEVSRIQRGDRRVAGIEVLERIADGLDMPDAARLALGLAPVCRHRYGSPAHLPPAPSGFAGRSAELAWLAEHAAGGRTLITGPDGAGKTTLALVWSHAVAHSFPDGQLYADMRGSGPDPVHPGDALAAWLRALDPDEARMPPTVEERTARCRTLLAGRRMLMLVDDVASGTQLRPLLPGDAGCLLVATSRDRVDDLVVRDGVPALRLTGLTTDGAVELLARVVGRSRIEAEPTAVRRLVDLCDRIPLPLREAAARLAERPGQSVSSLVADWTATTPLRGPRVA